MSSRITDNRTGAGYAIGDLALVIAAVALTLAVVLLDGPTLVRVPLGIVSVLVLPGYALAAALFPAGSPSRSAGDSAGFAHSPRRGITPVERAVLTVGLSLAVVALSGIGLDRLLGGIPTETLLGGVLAITAVSAAVAAVRRRGVEEDARYAPSIWIGAGGLRSASRPDALAILLALSVLFAGGAVAYAELGDDGSASLTEFYFVSEEADGEESYPTTFVRGTAQPITLAVGNGEGETTTYAVVGELQRVDRGEDSVTVEERTELSRDRLRVAAGETRTLDATVELDAPADTYRLVYLLYRGDPPADPQVSNAYREVHLWITVTDSAAEGPGEDG